MTRISTRDVTGHQSSRASRSGHWAIVSYGRAKTQFKQGMTSREDVHSHNLVEEVHEKDSKIGEENTNSER